MTSLDDARAVAEAVLYEGYVLYPYRASSRKNQSRWQFGVVMPAGYVEAEPSESSVQQTECLVDYGPDTEIDANVRFLRVLRRTEPGAAHWDEAVENAVTVGGSASRLIWRDLVEPLRVPMATWSQDGVTRRMETLVGKITMRAKKLPGPSTTLRLRVRLDNLTPLDRVPDRRDDALPYAFVAVHTILSVRHGRFLSMVDPPEWAAPAVAQCENIGTWPVLAGPPGASDVVLSSPIILYDHPGVAPESPGELYDGLEIDEILTLRTLALTDAEKTEARATDPRAAAIIDRVDAMDAAALERLHGTIRSLRPVADGDETPWWDPGADASVSPETDSVTVAGVRIARGSPVRLMPGARRADAQDMFLVGRRATVEAVLFDVDDGRYLAVTLDDDDNSDLQRAHGRFLYFNPDEVEPI